jgi:L-aspartate oxidase
LEFVQFHPTAVADSNGADGLLVTEAIRGEGARLLDGHGNRFVDELAPRDEVARAVAHQLALTGPGSVTLDMRSIDPGRFPNVFDSLCQAGIDARRQLVPIAPAAHYMMGGIATDLEARSTVPGLYAVGECSCTGLHGANRLASNSLSECFVFGARAARSAAGESGPQPDREAERDIPAHDPPTPSPDTRRALWKHAGLERDSAGLERLIDDPHPLARLIAGSALTRCESRGAHRRRDFPEPDPGLDRLHVTVSGEQAPRYEAWD